MKISTILLIIMSTSTMWGATSPTSSPQNIFEMSALSPAPRTSLKIEKKSVTKFENKLVIKVTSEDNKYKSSEVKEAEKEEKSSENEPKKKKKGFGWFILGALLLITLISINSLKASGFI